MNFSYEQLKSYTSPFLRREKIRFSDLNGLLGGNRKKDLRLARAFALQEHPEQSASKFSEELKKANPYLRGPITEEIARLREKPSICPRDREELERRIQRIFIDNGIYSDWGRPSSVGVILREDKALGVPIYYVLGESDGPSPFTGRLKLPTDYDRGGIILNITGSVARVKSLLDIYFLEPPKEHDPSDGPRDQWQQVFHQAVIWGGSDVLKSTLDRVHFEMSEFHLTGALSLMARRRFAMRMIYMMMNSQTTSEFFLKAVNSHIDSSLSHEAAHILERRENADVELDRFEKELLAYFVQGTHSQPDVAIWTMFDALPQYFQVENLMPLLARQMLKDNREFFLKGKKVLRKYMRHYADEYSIELTGKPATVLDGKKIRDLNTGSHFKEEDLAIIHEALCCTDAKGRHVELTG